MERFFLLDPYNEKQIDMLLSFEKDNSLDIVNSINKFTSKEEYLNNKKESNEIEEILFTEKEGKITDCCFIQGEKDRKICKIIPYEIMNKSKKRKLPLLASEYLLNTLDMEEVFIDVLPEDIGMQNYLLEKGFLSLGDNNGKLIYLKDREEKENSQRMI